MKILHYCARLRLIDGGVVRAVLDLTSALSPNVKSVGLLFTEGEDVPSANAGVQVIQTGSFDKKPMRFSKPRLASIAPLIESCDVLHLHTPWEPANLQLAAIARSVGTPYVISVHGMLDHWVMQKSTIKKKVFLALGGRKMFHNAAAVHCTANAEATQAKKRIPKSSFNVTPLVFNPQDYLHPPPSSDPDKQWSIAPEHVVTILFLSRIHPKKGIEQLLHSIASLHEKHSVRVMIAGSGEEAYEQRCHALAKELGIDYCVEFVGFVKGDRKISLYRLADLFALPTHQENFGIVFTESLASGVPVITTDGVDIWEELESSGGAIIVQDKESFTDALDKLISQQLLREEMGQVGQAWIKEQFEGNQVINEYISMYRNAINQ